MTLAGKMALGLLALGVSTYAVSEALAHSRSKISPRLPSPAPTPPSSKGGDPYVGSGWTGWPHKDVFPDVDAIVQAFRSLGYDVSSNLITAKSMSEVGRFQADYNLWASLFGDPRLELTGLEDPASPHGLIGQDDLVGTQTINALYDALVADQSYPDGWPALVAWYRAQV